MLADVKSLVIPACSPCYVYFICWWLGYLDLVFWFLPEFSMTVTFDVLINIRCKFLHILSKPGMCWPQGSPITLTLSVSTRVWWMLIRSTQSCPALSCPEGGCEERRLHPCGVKVCKPSREQTRPDQLESARENEVEIESGLSTGMPCPRK